MTPSELKEKTAETSPEYFTRSTMGFFGDTMKNYGCCSAVVDTWTQEKVDCWELYRKHPVKNGLQTSTYFDKKTFERVYAKI